MSDQAVICLHGVGKLYKLFPSRFDNFLDAIGLAGWLPWRTKPQEFWALRGINLEVRRGQRLGIIGRNGAGKSTLLKLITGNLPATEGSLDVRGQIQALLDAGAGFHPEFTGYENIRAALTLQGLTAEQIQVASEEIADFTELGPFLAQPLKTYSAGMQARLVFATATTVRPDILIIDEILGAGDAYFAAKATERMRELVSGGATVLIVSHALDSVMQFCEEAIWIERGRIIKRGPSMEVINAYEGFIHTLDDRRLRARNRRIQAGGGGESEHRDTFYLTFRLKGRAEAACDVARVQLFNGDELEEELRIGDVQDTNPSFSAYLDMHSLWSEPRFEGNPTQPQGAFFFRSLTAKADGLVAVGNVMFEVFAASDERRFLRIKYRCPTSADFSFSLTHNGVVMHHQTPLATELAEWHEQDIPLTPAVAHDGDSVLEGKLDRETNPNNGRSMPPVRWPSEGSLLIEHVVLLDEAGNEQTVFKVGAPMTVQLTVIAQRDACFNLVSGLTLHRLDGVFISNFVGPVTRLNLVSGQSQALRMRLPAILWGDGTYRFTGSIFEKVVADETRYDLVVHACELKIVGNEPLFANAVFRHPGEEWEVVQAEA